MVKMSNQIKTTISVHASNLDKRRLAHAIEAPVELSDNSDILKQQIDKLGNALTAMQSLDSLGSPEANEWAMNEHDKILDLLRNAEAKLRAFYPQRQCPVCESEIDLVILNDLDARHA